ncbi:MAG: HAD family hydrolase [Alphaproteobacteria bacterium]|nr:HAD family hydrolase [Alphaproteobacteria bacterium]
MQKTLVIWDWDNTLCNTKNAVLKGLKDTVQHFNSAPVKEEEVINVMTRHRGAFWTSRFPLEKIDERPSLPEAIEYYVSCYQKYSNETALFDDALAVISFLKQCQIPQVILSNKNHEALVKEVKDKGVFDYFDIVKGTKGPLGKPEKEFALDIIEAIKPDKIIFIGDGHSDMMMAKNIGAIPILVHHLDSELPYDYFCSTLFETGIVLTWLLKNNQ